MTDSSPAERRTAQYFEDLWIWQQARSLVNTLYGDFGDATPAARHFAFRDQLDRAAVSIMNNIAEGFERGTDSDFARFLDIARASVAEVRSMLYVAEDRKLISAAVADERRTQCRQIASGIASLSSHLRTTKNATRPSRK